MSVKSKKMRKIARNAAMSALIVSAIVGTSVVASAAATTTDNLTITDSAAFGRVATADKAGIVGGTVDSSTVKTIGGLSVSGGTLYVSKDLTVHGKNMGAEKTNTNAYVTGGKVVVGMNSAGTSVTPKSVTMTVDNMTIAGGEVSVTGSNTLKSTGDIDINGGKLLLTGHYKDATTPDPASGSTVIAKNVNVNAGGTLEAGQGLQNVIRHAVHTSATDTGAVNLRGGTIVVAQGGVAALTITDQTVGTNFHPGLSAGDLYVASKGVLNSYGGTIKANLKSDGTTNFKGGITTVDNMTVSDGTTVIEGNAVVESKGNVNIDGLNAELNMKGGTLRVLDPAGAVNVMNGGELEASAGINTIDAKVNVTKGGVVDVSGSALLTITKDLNVDADASSRVIVAGNGAHLILQGGLTTSAANQIVVGTDTFTGQLTVGHKVLTGASVTAGSIKMGTGVVGAANKNGTLILTGYEGANFNVDATGAVTAITDKTQGGMLTGKYEDNNIVIWGKDLVVGGKVVEAKADGTANFTAGVNVTIVPATGSTASIIGTGTITAPSVSTASGALEVNSAGSLALIGVGMGDASNKTTNLTTLKMDTSGGVSVSNGATLNAGTLDMTKGNLDVINAVANIGTLKATAGTIFVDPAIVTIDRIQDNDLKAVSLLTSSGSVVTLGGAAGWMDKPMKDAGFTPTATLGIATTETIKITSGVVAVDGSIVVDSTKTSGYAYTKADGTTVADATRANMGAFYAGANTLTVIDASGLDKGEAVFDLGGANNNVANIDANAKLHVANLTVNDLQIFSGGTVATGGTGWSGANLIQPDRMLDAEMLSNGLLVATAKLASDALGMSGDFNGLMAGVWENAHNNTNSSSAGIRLVSRAASKDFGLSTEMAAKTIEGAAQLGAVAGVQGVTMGAANAATSAVATRTSFAQPLMDKSKAVAMHIDSEGSVSLDAGLNAGDGMKNGFALWIMPLYQSNNVWGMKAGNFKSGYNSDLGGVALGADYTIDDMFRFGAALNIGAGYSQSSGDFNSTDNSFNFWGINLYGGWNMNNFGVTADVGYTGNYNKVEQDVPVSLQVPNLKADINSSAWTAGLKAEYKLETSMVDIIPHVGVRFLSLNTDEYSVKGGGTVFKVDQENQSVWTFPIGVAFTKDFTSDSGWVFKPQLDLAVVPAAGDVKVRSKSRIPGAPGSSEAKMQVVDYVSFDGGLGFDIANDNLSFGLNYNVQASEHRTSHGVFGTVRYEF